MVSRLMRSARVNANGRDHAIAEDRLVFGGISSQDVQVSAELLSHFRFRRTGRQLLNVTVDKRTIVGQPARLPRLGSHPSNDVPSLAACCHIEGSGANYAEREK